MFGLARRKSRSQLVRAELGESLDHFVQAATHAARGAEAVVGPRVVAARGRVTPAAGRVRTAASGGWGSTVAALAPLAATATQGAGRASRAADKAKAKNNAKALRSRTKAIKGRKAGGSRSKFATLAIAGAAIGAVGALVLRRRQQQMWDQYDPSRPLGADTDTMPSPPPVVLPEHGIPTTTSTASTGTGATATSTSATGSLVAEHAGDQTASPMHSPTVARMAGGTSSDTVDDLPAGTNATRPSRH